MKKDQQKASLSKDAKYMKTKGRNGAARGIRTLDILNHNHTKPFAWGLEDVI